LHHLFKSWINTLLDLAQERFTFFLDFGYKIAIYWRFGKKTIEEAKEKRRMKLIFCNLLADQIQDADADYNANRRRQDVG
jgi:hypothetical protein